MQKLTPFPLERFFSKHEFTAKYTLCSSDPETLTLQNLLALEPGAYEALGALGLGYRTTRGAETLRQRIAALHGLSVSSAVLVHAGAQEPIFAFMTTQVAAGDHVIAQFPAYTSLYAIAEAQGATVTRWQGDPSNRWQLDPDDLPSMVRPETRGIVISSPHNPTGAVIDERRFRAIVDFCRAHGLWLLSDEVYRGLERDLPTPRSAAELYERAVAIGGLAKVYGLPGLRIGWAVSQDEKVLRAMESLKDYLTICAAGPSEFLAELALRHESQLRNRVRDLLSVNLSKLELFMARWRDVFEWYPPMGSTLAFPRLRDHHAEAFCEGVLSATGVLLMPSTVFDAGDTHVRVGYGREDFDAALARVDEHLTVSVGAR